MKIAIVGVRTDFGSGRRGVDMGPSAIRYAGLQAGLERLGHDVYDLGDISLPVVEQLAVGDPSLKYLEGCIAAAEGLAARIEGVRDEGRIAIVLGGDHSLALGSVAVAARGRELGLLWVDAHGDFNTTATTPSGNIHGMPLAALCGFGDGRLVNLLGDGPKVNPRHVAIVGARSLDEGEKRLLREAGVAVFTMQQIDRQGLAAVMAAALEVVRAGGDGFHVSFDLDVVDPTQAPGVGTPVPGGISYREAHLLMELVAEDGGLTSLDLVEVNPILDRQNVTGQLAAEMAWSAFGKSIF
ncbi:MAG TPA: arginase [Chloroflexota bacterium]|nr:arginase [Chloroflexota bacterium]